MRARVIIIASAMIRLVLLRKTREAKKRGSLISLGVIPRRLRRLYQGC